MFDCSYSDLRLIDIQSLKESLPLTITELRKNTHKATQKGIKRLLDGWIPSCVKIISDRRDDIEEWMPEDEVKIDSMSSSTIFSELLYRAQSEDYFQQIVNSSMYHNNDRSIHLQASLTWWRGMTYPFKKLSNQFTDVQDGGQVPEHWVLSLAIVLV